MVAANFYDGVTATRHTAEAWIEGGRLIVRREGAEEESAPLAEIETVEEDKRLLVLGRRDRPGWRLVVQQPVDPAFRDALPKPSRYGGWIDRVGLGKATVMLGAVAAAVLFVGYSAPVWLTPLVPESWERNLGDALVGDFGDTACRTPAGDAALKRMAARVEPAVAGLSVIPMTVINVGIFNAAALPGQRIVIFEGALDETDNADAMAGILAHEIAHVRKRHVTQALIRELGIGALVRLFAGDIGANAQQLVSLSYTRGNEEEADREAIAALKRANLDPRPTGALFRKLSREAGGLDAVQWLNSHPRSADRAKAFDQSYDPKAAYTPSLSQADYDRLRDSCIGKKDEGEE